MFPFDVILFDVGGVLLTNGWDTQERTLAIERFHLDPAGFEARHQAAYPAWERGTITVRDYLDATVFNEPCKFSQDEFFAFMLAQSKLRNQRISLRKVWPAHLSQGDIELLLPGRAKAGQGHLSNGAGYTRPAAGTDSVHRRSNGKRGRCGKCGDESYSVSQRARIAQGVDKSGHSLADRHWRSYATWIDRPGQDGR